MSLLVTSPALRIEELKHDGYLIEDIGLAKLIDHYHKFYFYFNISIIETNYKTLIANAHILELRSARNDTSHPLINSLKDTCLEIENELSKFNHRSKRSLINGLGTAIRYVTGNLDQNDLKNINDNLNILLQNQEKVVKHVNSFTSFANHITERYSKDLITIQSNLNSSLNALANLENRLNEEVLIQYNLHMARKILSILQSIQRTITLAFKEITNLEIISSSELEEIIDHLKLIYKSDELLELDNLHLFKLIEFSKFKVISINNTITCIFYIPILKTNLYTYQRIYPIPNKHSSIMVPPAKYRITGAIEESWTNEECSLIENQILCLQEPRIHDCSLNEISKCKFISVINNYKLVKQLNNNKIIISSKTPVNVFEECRNKVDHQTVIESVLISSRNNCKIIIDKVNYHNTYSNLTYRYYVPKISNYQPIRKINLKQKHLDDIHLLEEESQELMKNVVINHLVHVSHISVTAILILILCVTCMLTYAFRTRIIKFFRKEETLQAAIEMGTLLRNENHPGILASLPASNGEDALA